MTNWTEKTSLKLAATREQLGLSPEDVDVLTEVLTGSSVRPKELARLENPNAEHVDGDWDMRERILFVYWVVINNRFNWNNLLRRRGDKHGQP